MNTKINQNHSIETFYYSLSRMLERLAFYGLRTLIVVYMIDEFSNIEQSEAIEVFGWFSLFVLISKIVGAILGDLLIGSKKAIVIGGIIQAIGAFSFCIPSEFGLYLGLLLVATGSGLYTPNIIASFGKSYLNKTKLLDSGYSILYLAVNIGSFLGVVFISYLGEEYGRNVGFIISGIIVLLSLIPFLKTKNQEITFVEEKYSYSYKKVIKVIAVFCLVSLFWFSFDIGSIQTLVLQPSIRELLAFEIPNSIFITLSSYIYIPISIVAIIMWSIYYSNIFSKLSLGFIFSAISFGILLLIPEIPSEKHIIFYFISLIFLSISEVYISPIIHSTLTKYSNPKYLAILISLAFMPTRLFSIILNLFDHDLYTNPILGLTIAIVTVGIISIGLILYNNNRKTTYNTC